MESNVKRGISVETGDRFMGGMKGVCFHKKILFIIFGLVYVTGFEGTVRGIGL